MIQSLLSLASLFCIRGQDGTDGTFYLDALRDVTQEDGSWRSTIEQLNNHGSEHPQVELSGFLDFGCVRAVSVPSVCQATTLTQSSRLDCVSWCEGLPLGRLPRTLLVRGRECFCCDSDNVLGAAEAATCNLLCDDQELGIYAASAFQSKPSVRCGGAEHVYSALREFDGLSPLGRRGVFSARFGIWYQVVVASVPASVQADVPPGITWQTYADVSHYLHAVAIETGQPVFHHHMRLGFVPECIQYDGVAQKVVTLARATTGGVYVALLCPGCPIRVEVMEALSTQEADQYELSMPACSFDPEGRVLALVVVPRSGAAVTASLLEVNIVHRTVSWKASEQFEEVAALELCKPLPSEADQPPGFTALFTAPAQAGSEGEFLLADPEAFGTVQLPRCSEDGQACAGAGPDQEFVYLTGSASHPTHPFVFFATEPGENSSDVEGEARVAQSRCDGSGSFLWTATGDRSTIAIEAPFDRTDPAGWQLAAPRLILAEFLTSGRQMMLTFNRPTLMGAQPRDTDMDGIPDAHSEADAWGANFPCHWVVGVQTLQQLMLQDSSCTWMTEQELVVDLPAESPADIGSPVFIRSGVLFAHAPGSYSPPASGGVFLQPPQSQARAPEPVVSGSRQVDFCSNLELDALASRYTAGQPNVTWRLAMATCLTAEEPSPAGYCNTTDIELAMEAAGTTLQIASDERPVELRVLDIEVVVFNRWGIGASLMVQVNISQVPQPSLDISASPLNATPFHGVALRADVKQSGCLQAPLSYSWSLLSVSASPAVTPSSSQAMEDRAWQIWESPAGGSQLAIGWNSPSLLFPPLSLAAGVIYTFELEVKPLTSLPGYAAATAIDVRVDPSPLQMAFQQPLSVIRRSEDAEIDMAPSFDPDNPEALLPTPSWSCKALEPEDACDGLAQVLAAGIANCTDSDATVLLRVPLPLRAFACRPSPSALLVRGILRAGVKVQLVAKVAADIVPSTDVWWRSPSLLLREATASAEVVVLEDTSLALQPITAWIVSLSRFRLSEHQPLRLEGFGVDEAAASAAGASVLGSYGNLAYSWEVERFNSNPVWDATRAVLEGDSYQVPREIYSAVPSTQARLTNVSAGSSLVLPAKSLAAGAQYRFVLKVSDRDDPARFAVAAVEIKVIQSQPLQGLLRVTPTQGTAGVTSFALEAYGWGAEEDGLPLLYDFGYIDDSDAFRLGGGLREIGLGTGPRAVLHTADVPAGQITFFVDVYTTWGGSLRATAAATVHALPPTNATAERMRAMLAELDLVEPAQAISKLPVLLSQFPSESGNVSSSILMTSFLSSWSKNRDRLLSSTAVGLPSWPPPGLGLTLSLLLESLRPICRHFSGDEARLECAKGLRPLVAASLPSASVIDKLRLMPERCPEPILKPESRLASSMVRSLADLALMERQEAATNRRLADTSGGDNSSGNSSNDSNDGNGSTGSISNTSLTQQEGVQTSDLASPIQAMTWILDSMAQAHYTLTPHLTPGESFEILAPGMRFLSTRMERGENQSTYSATRPFLLEDESGFLNPTSWLYVGLGMMTSLELPDGVLPTNSTGEAGSLQDGSESELPVIALLAVCDSVGIPRKATAKMFGYLQEIEPAASCYRWQAGESPGWLREGVAVEESGSCTVTVGPEGHVGVTVLLGLFLDSEEAPIPVGEASELVGELEKETTPPPLLAAFGGVAALLLLNVGIAALSRLADIKVKSDSKVKAPPRDYWETPGYKLARVLPDPLVYGTDAEEIGVHIVRSWLSVCLASHLFVGIYSSDEKVPVHQKVAALLATCVAATGCSSVLLVRLGYSAGFSAALGGACAWPLGLLMKWLYEWRPWCPAEGEILNEVLDAGEQARIQDLLADDKEASSVRTDPAKSPFEASSGSEGEKQDPPGQSKQKLVKKPSSEAVTDAAAAGASAASAASASAASAKAEPQTPTIVLTETPGMKGLRLGASPQRMDLLRVPAAAPPKFPALQLLKSSQRMHRLPSRQLSLPPSSRERRAAAGDEGTPHLQSAGLVFASKSLDVPLWLQQARALPKAAESGLYHQGDGRRLSCGAVLEKAATWQRSEQSLPPATGPLQKDLEQKSRSNVQALEAARLIATGELLAAAVSDPALPMRNMPLLPIRVPLRPLPPPSRDSMTEALREVDALLASLQEEPPPAAVELLEQLPYEEQSLKHMMKQIQRMESAHVRRLERAYVQEAKQHLPEEVSLVMLLLAYLATMGLFMAGVGSTVSYWAWIAPSAVGDYLAAIMGSMATVSVLELLRMVLILLVAMSRLETLRRESQARWTRKHPELLEVRPAAPLASIPGPGKRRWPGLPPQPQPPPPPPQVPRSATASRGASASSLSLKSQATQSGLFWALPRKLRRGLWQSARVSPEKGAEQKPSARWSFLRKVGIQPDDQFGVVPTAKAQAREVQRGPRVSQDEVKQRLEAREAERVAKMMDMVPPWEPERWAQRVPARSEAPAVTWPSASSVSSKRTKTNKSKGSRVRFAVTPEEEMSAIVPSGAPKRAPEHPEQ
ncbi:unnamed protein product [Effrenium voratum]|uniref:PKD/REJ-like domain-containing protein n=1 Tax=Effrenium voratum TaxID=2562239 RepID=A0AA36JL41_9DINO|nr:unnamed protein product [Effrenium voratum]